MKRNFKRAFLGGDLHCGHRVGLTPPFYQNAIPGDKYHKIQMETWNWFRDELKPLKPFDVAILNADLVDGKGKRSGSSELITADWHTQRKIAVECIKEIGAPVIRMTYGTPYHVGDDSDHESPIVDMLKEEGFEAQIRSQGFWDINGTTFDVKHKVGSSSIPHGKGTSIAKERLWNALWADIGEQVRADVIIRSHVHYHYYCGEPEWLAMTLPALQGQGTKFGARQCSGIVHFGFVVFDCFEDGGYTWEPHIINAVSQRRTAESL